MKSLGPALLILGSLLATHARAQRGEIQVAAGLGSERTYLGEPVDYTVEVRNVDDAPDPDLSAYTEFDVRLVDKSAGSFSHFVNGRGTSYTSIRFAYSLTPTKSGDLTVPPAIVRLDGKEYRGPELRLEVIPPEPSDLVHLHSSVERSGRFPLQSFDVTLRVFIKKLPAPHSAQDPIEYMNPPRLQIPWVDVPDGLASIPEDRWLLPRRARFDGRATHGFSINDRRYGAAGMLGPFSLLGPRGPEVFQLDGRPATPADVVGVDGFEGRHDEYFVYSLSRRFVPQRAGTYELAPATVKGDFISGVRGSRPITRSAFTAGNAVTVAVDDAPRNGRPDGYSGAFGRDYTVTTDVRPRRGRVGDPLTLTLEIAGVGNLGAIEAPDLNAMPAIADAFQVEVPTIDRTGSNPVFTYSVRARRADVDSFPPIAFSYFDLATERYRTVESDPVPLEIDDIGSLGASDVVKFDRGSEGQSELSRAEGLFGNVNDPRQVSDDAVDARVVFATPPLLAVLYGIVVFWVARHRRLHSDAARQRRRGAADRARAGVREATTAIARGDVTAGATGLRDSIVALVADALDLPTGGLTPRETAARLEEVGVDAPLVGRVRDTLAAIDGLRYGGEASTLGAESAAVLDDLIDALHRRRRLK